MDLEKFEEIVEKKIGEGSSGDDPAHDLLHIKRVVATAKKIMSAENAKPEVVVPAAWLHDFVVIPKGDPRRGQASKISAEEAVAFLREIRYPEIHLKEIAHAIESHSFSAGIEPKTIEAQVVQEADRLDALGAVGIARCFATAGVLKRSLYRSEDPFCERTEPDDDVYTVDHFYRKLFKIAEALKTKTGREIGLKRVGVMKNYLQNLRSEVDGE